MNFYIKEWPDNTATLMTGIGQVLWKFSSVDEARQACEDYYDLNAVEVEYREDIGLTRGNDLSILISDAF